MKREVKVTIISVGSIVMCLSIVSKYKFIFLQFLIIYLLFFFMKFVGTGKVWVYPKTWKQSKFYLTNRFHFCVRLYCNRSQITSWRVKNKKVHTRRSRVPWLFVLHTLWRHVWSITVQKTKKWNLFVLYGKKVGENHTKTRKINYLN